MVVDYDPIGRNGFHGLRRLLRYFILGITPPPCELARPQPAGAAVEPSSMSPRHHADTDEVAIELAMRSLWDVLAC
jgi:hypothetical protein